MYKNSIKKFENEWIFHNLSRHIQINFDCGNRKTKDPFKCVMIRIENWLIGKE